MEIFTVNYSISINIEHVDPFQIFS
jgi:hypothetical protein